MKHIIFLLAIMFVGQVSAQKLHGVYRNSTVGAVKIDISYNFDSTAYRFDYIETHKGDAQGAGMLYIVGRGTYRVEKDNLLLTFEAIPEKAFERANVPGQKAISYQMKAAGTEKMALKTEALALTLGDKKYMLVTKSRPTDEKH